MLLDNKKNEKVGDELYKHLTDGSKLSVISGMFSIYGFASLQKDLRQISGIRLILSQVSTANNASWDLPFPHLVGDHFELRFKNQLTQAHIAKECGSWLREKAEIRMITNPGAISQNLFHVQGEGENAIAIHGSSSFTCTGLGYAESDRYHMNMCESDTTNTADLLEWFETIGNDTSAVQDAKELLLKQLANLVKDQSPEFMYFLTLYNIFKDVLDDIDEENIIKTKTGFKETLVWNKLYKFQRDGVLGAIDKMEKYNGCIIADSVGLGKTFEALAVIKYYELRNDRVLVLCPKKLRDNWTVYTINDKRNLFSMDRFNYDVLNHTDLTRLQGRSGAIN